MRDRGLDVAINPAALPMRLLARMLDVIAMAWLTVVIVIEVEGPLFADRTFTQVAVTSIVVALGYEILPTAYRGATIGKGMLGMKVVRADDGGRPGLARSLLRYLVVLAALAPRFFLLPAAALAVPALIDTKRRRAVQDWLAGTAVVTSR